MVNEQIDKTVRLFSLKRYKEDNFIERDLLRKELTHNLFLYLCDGMNLDFVIWRPEEGKLRDCAVETLPKCVIEKKRSEIEDFSYLVRISFRLFSIVQTVIENKEDYQNKYSELTRLYKSDKVGVSKKNQLSDIYQIRRKELIFSFIENIQDDTEQLKTINGFIYYLSNRVSNIKVRLNEKKWIRELKILKISLKQLAEVEINTTEKDTNYSLAYKIALLNELGFFDIPTVRQLSNNKQDEIIKILTGGSTRQIRGNIRVLDPKSTEDRLRYTSFSYMDKVKKLLQ